MAESDFAEKINNDEIEEFSTDVCTGNNDKRMYLYYQLVNGLCRKS